MNLKAFSALVKAFADTDSRGAFPDRLTEAITNAGLSATEHGDTIAAFIDAEGMSGAVPPDLLESYVRYSERLKAEADAERDRERAAACFDSVGTIVKELRENVARGVSPDDSSMAAKIAEVANTLTGIATGKGKTLDPLADFLARKYAEDATRKHEDLLGLDLRRFHFLAKKLDGIQPGFYIAAAETNIGKTAFLANVFLDALEANPKTPGLFVTLDDPKSVVVDRFTAILARLAYRQGEGEDPSAFARERAELNINRLRKNLDSWPRMKAAKEEAAAQLASWAKTGRLDIRDITELSTGDALERYIRGMAKGGRKPFVVIDALFNLDIGGGAGNLREENIERAQFLKKLSDDLTIPIWTTAEIRKRNGGETSKHRDYASKGAPTTDDIMESSKYAYNANAVFMLYPEKWDDFTAPDNLAPHLVIDVQKNKLSDFKRALFATFTKKAAFMELEGPDYKPAKAEKPEKEGHPDKGKDAPPPSRGRATEDAWKI